MGVRSAIRERALAAKVDNEKGMTDIDPCCIHVVDHIFVYIQSCAINATSSFIFGVSLERK